MPFLGEIAALITSIFYSIGPTFFTLAGRLVGSAVVNRTRLVVALVYLTIVHWVFYGTPLPLDAAPDRWFWLAVSGLVGFVLGDAALFQAFIVIGTRLTMLVFALNPILGAVLAWLFLGEDLTGMQLLGMAITLAGIAWVLFERNNPTQQELTPKAYAMGIFLAVLARHGASRGDGKCKIRPVRRFPHPFRADHAGGYCHRHHVGNHPGQRQSAPYGRSGAQQPHRLQTDSAGFFPWAVFGRVLFPARHPACRNRHRQHAHVPPTGYPYPHWLLLLQREDHLAGSRRHPGCPGRGRGYLFGVNAFSSPPSYFIPFHRTHAYIKIFSSINKKSESARRGKNVSLRRSNPHRHTAGIHYRVHHGRKNDQTIHQVMRYGEGEPILPGKMLGRSNFLFDQAKMAGKPAVFVFEGRF